jgi:hypothetical protein
MRKFSSYGPVDTELHYFAPRQALIESAYSQLVGEKPTKSSHYVTVWAPRQTGKTWIMQKVVHKLKQEKEFEVGIFSMESAKKEKDEQEILKILTYKLGEIFQKKFPVLKKIRDIQTIFTKRFFQKPVILIIDEFDSLEEDFINSLAGIFRDMFIGRAYESDKKSKNKTYLLHGLALVGVRSVLGIENIKGSPFNVQRSVHIPNLTFDEVNSMFKWHEKESGQKIADEVIAKLFKETGGQPGLTCWFGELLTETYNQKKDEAITIDKFEEAYAAATYTLPNNNILNIISKVKQSPYREWIFSLFKPGEKINFKFDDEHINYLYMNGIVKEEKVSRMEYYVKFSSPFVQKRLFNYFANELFDYMGQLVEPFEKLDDAVTESGLNIRNLLKHYNRYLTKNRDWLLKDAPRRKDLRIYEAVYHFNLYMYLFDFLKVRGGKVYPEFPTGNGKIDLMLHYRGRVYGLELKSFSHETAYNDALKQAARYAHQLGLNEISLIFFVESIDKKNRQIYEQDFKDKITAVRIKPVFIETGIPV